MRPDLSLRPGTGDNQRVNEIPDAAVSTATTPAAPDETAAPPRADSITRNTAFGLATQLTTAAFTAALTLILVRVLGPDEYGVFAIAVGMGTLLVLVSDF